MEIGNNGEPIVDLTAEWDDREKVTGVTSLCCKREACRGGISGALYCPGCGKHVNYCPGTEVQHRG